jgi:hypothetical protein
MLGLKPGPDLATEERRQSRRASHSLSSFAGEIKSPKISTESLIDPIQAERSLGGLGLRTRSSKARHFAPNTEITVCFMCLAQHIIHDSLRNRDTPQSAWPSHSSSNRSQALLAAASCSCAPGASGPVFSFNSSSRGKSLTGAVFKTLIDFSQPIVPS